MLIRPWLFAAMLAFGIPAHAAQHDEADEALIDRLLEASPYSERFIADAAPDPDTLARLQALNPGQADTVRRLLETQRRCEVTFLLAWTRNGLREVARRLGRAKTERLIQFYSGPDFPALNAINERSDRGEAPSEAEVATIDRIMREYPLMEAAETAVSLDLTRDPNLIASIGGCLADRNAAFDRVGIRQATD